MTSVASSGVLLLRVLIHHAREQLLVEAAPVDADAHRLAVADRALDHGGELLVALRAAADVAGIDAVLGERLRAIRILRQQLVAVVVEVADQRHVAAARVEPLADARDLRAPPPACSTVMRTSSEPARASASTWRAVASASSVSVLVIDCTTTGAPPPMRTSSTATWREILRFMGSGDGEARDVLTLVCGCRSSERSLCSTRTWLALPMTSVERPAALHHALATRRVERGKQLAPGARP